MPPLIVLATKFLSTPSARRATVLISITFSSLKISIHALREEGDDELDAISDTPFEFLSTPSARRATQLPRHQ